MQPHSHDWIAPGSRKTPLSFATSAESLLSKVWAVRFCCWAQYHCRSSRAMRVNNMAFSSRLTPYSTVPNRPFLDQTFHIPFLAFMLPHFSLFYLPHLVSIGLCTPYGCLTRWLVPSHHDVSLFGLNVVSWSLGLFEHPFFFCLLAWGNYSIFPTYTCTFLFLYLYWTPFFWIFCFDHDPGRILYYTPYWLHEWELWFWLIYFFVFFCFFLFILGFLCCMYVLCCAWGAIQEYCTYYILWNVKWHLYVVNGLL